MRQRKDIKQAVKSKGVEAVNSDEELNGILDQAQQEKFIQSMHAIAEDYMRSWGKLFSWLSVLIIYINVLALLGMIPVTRQFFTFWVPRSVTVQFLLSPVWLGSAWFGHYLPLCLQLVSTSLVFHLFFRSLRGPLGGLPRLIRFTGLVSFLLWTVTSYCTLETWIWGKHTVIVVSLPLLCIAADTYVGAKDLAFKGIEKLNSLKYSHKKV